MSLSIVTTHQNETVLDGYFPEMLNQTPSALLYQKTIGEALLEDKLFVVLGSDSGLILDYLSQISTSGQRFVVIDYPEVIEHIKNSRAEILSDSEHFRIELFSFEVFEFEQLYVEYQDYAIRNAIFLLSALVTLEAKGRYASIQKQYKELFSHFQIDRVDNHDFTHAFDQQLESVCDRPTPLSSIKQQLKGDVPGILLGGGPSLDLIIPWIKENQAKIWIFAASRICKRLQKEGITPDFIGVFDGQPLILEYSKEMYGFEKNSILITGEHPYRPLIRQWSGLKVYSRRRFPWAKGGEDNFISDGPTVTNALFGIAHYLGVSTLYLGGVDFCFSLDGACHESGSIERSNQQSDSAETTAINYRGEKVGTNIQLYDARNLFEAQFQRLHAGDRSLKAYNLNEGAAKIEGIGVQSIEEIVLLEDKFDVVSRFNDALNYTASSEALFLKQLSEEIKTHEAW
ncbi:MAG: motility associated factor glycosyltransferase family protein, partial [Gammaproteobacteria bacterium]|nr:motility associated factor glycosyltransferase family protein [Gammaproteobacteria bacterium]